MQQQRSIIQEFLYEDKVRFRCQNKEQAKALKQCMSMIGVLPAELSLRIFGALSRHKKSLEHVAKASKGDKTQLLLHSGKLLAFAKDIAGM